MPDTPVKMSLTRRVSQQDHQGLNVQEPAPRLQPILNSGRSSFSQDAELKQPSSKFKTSFRKRLTAEIDTKGADYILIACFFCVGLTDTLAFVMYGCFVGMQTGNTIFVGLGAAGLPATVPRYQWVKSLVAIFAFAFGAWTFATFHRISSPLKRWVLISSFLIQTAMIALIAGLATGGVLDNKPLHTQVVSSDANIITITIEAHFPWSELAPIILLSFQTAGAIVASRVLKFNSLPTVVITSLLCDLLSDPKLLTAPFKDNVERNRRTAGAICLFLGAVAGAFLSKSWVGFAGALWITALLKFIMAVSLFLWRPKP